MFYLKESQYTQASEFKRFIHLNPFLENYRFPIIWILYCIEKYLVTFSFFMHLILRLFILSRRKLLIFEDTIVFDHSSGQLSRYFNEIYGSYSYSLPQINYTKIILKSFIYFIYCRLILVNKNYHNNILGRNLSYYIYFSSIYINKSINKVVIPDSFSPE